MEFVFFFFAGNEMLISMDFPLTHPMLPIVKHQFWTPGGFIWAMGNVTHLVSNKQNLVRCW